MLEHRRTGLRVAERQSGSPFEVGDERGAELGVGGHRGIIGGKAAVAVVDAVREERREKIVPLDPVIEGVDHPVERRLPACPLIQRRIVSGHKETVVPLGVANGRGTLRIGVALGAGGLIGGYYEARIQPRRPQVSELSTVDPGRSPAAG